MRNKYVCFDIGNVICNVDFEAFILHMQNELGVPRYKTWDFLVRTQKLHDVGLSTMKDEAVTFCGEDADKQKTLLKEWNKTVKANKTMVKFIKEIILKGGRVALLSNMGYDHSELMKTELSEIYHSCDKFLSCEVGLRKPTIAYYHLFLEMYPDYAASGPLLYVDDRRENLDAAFKLGFWPEHFELDKYDETKLEEKIEDLRHKIEEFGYMI